MRDEDGGPWDSQVPQPAETAAMSGAAAERGIGWGFLPSAQGFSPRLGLLRRVRADGAAPRLLGRATPGSAMPLLLSKVLGNNEQNLIKKSEIQQVQSAASECEMEPLQNKTKHRTAASRELRGLTVMLPDFPGIGGRTRRQEL